MKVIVVTINNFVETLEAGSTVSDVLKQVGYKSDEMLGVAINQVFIPKDQWQTTQLRNDDKIDVLNPVSGG